MREISVWGERVRGMWGEDEEKMSVMRKEWNTMEWEGKKRGETREWGEWWERKSDLKKWKIKIKHNKKDWERVINMIKETRYKYSNRDE